MKIEKKCKQIKSKIVFTQDISEINLIYTDLEYIMRGYQRVEIKPFMELEKDTAYQIKYELMEQ